ncbi:MAG: hypothetical protein AAFR44_15915, partial [Pseudomonadota bacterium]
LSGDAAADYVVQRNQQLASYDVEDGRFSREASLALDRDYDHLISVVIPQEIRLGNQLYAAAVHANDDCPPDFVAFEHEVLSGCRVPTEAESLCYAAAPPTVAEVARSHYGLHPGRRGSSLDDVAPEALRYGGPVGDLVAARFARGLWTNGFRLPTTWLRPEQLDVYKGAPRDPLAVESQRPLSIQSFAAKSLEGVVLQRLAVLAPAPIWQGVANRGVGVVHNLHVVLDVTTYRYAHGQPTFGAIDDIRRGYPSTSHKEAALALHRQGARGHVLCALHALYSDVQVRVQLAPGRFSATTVALEVGLLQGGRSPPAQFTAMARSSTMALVHA